MWEGERGRVHRVEEQLVAVLARDGDQPVARVPALHDVDARLAVLGRPATTMDIALQKGSKYPLTIAA